MTNHNFRTLLVAMPFQDIHLPNISLGILKSVINNSGYNCDVYYANLDFAAIIGRDLYNYFQKMNAFTGELLFSQELNGTTIKIENSNLYNELSSKEKLAFQEIRNYIKGFVDGLAEKIVSQKYDLIGFSLIFQTIPSLVLAKRIKELAPHLPIICGGANCEGGVGLTIHQNFKYIDYVCQGEGEVLIVELLDKLAGKGGNFNDIKGLVWRENDRSVANGVRTDFIHNIDIVPTPDYTDWWKQVNENALYYETDEWGIPFESSRGCWYGNIKQCVFCGLGGEDLTSRIKSAERVIEDLEVLKANYPINNFVAVDLAFPNQYYKEFIPILISKELDIVLNYEIKANISKRQLFQLRDANVMLIQPGIESLSSPVLKTMRKGVKSFVNIRLLKWAFGLGINVIWNILYGTPGEDKSEYAKMAKLIALISHLQPPVYGCMPINLVKFSPLFKERESLGIENVRPVEYYKEVFNLPEEQIMKIAYYHEFGKNNAQNFNYVEPLINSVNKWHEKVGEEQLFSINNGEQIHICDTREIALNNRFTLNGLEKQIYSICDSGSTLEVICQKMKVSESKVKNILNFLLENKLLLYIDGKYLSLAVEMDELAGNFNDIETAIHLCSHIYRAWMKSKCEPYLKTAKIRSNFLEEKFV